MKQQGNRFTLRYIPFSLSEKDTEKQKQMLNKSRRQYLQGKYFTRKKLSSFRNRPSNHIKRAKQIYELPVIKPNDILAKATGCSVNALRKIVRKGEGAYFSSGSRPNQTATSWGIARLASAITGGKSASVDYAILEKGCSKNSVALKMAKQALQKYGNGHGKTRKRRFG